MGSGVQRFMGSEVQRFRVKRFMGSKVLGSGLVKVNKRKARLLEVLKVFCEEVLLKKWLKRRKIQQIEIHS